MRVLTAVLVLVCGCGPTGLQGEGPSEVELLSKVVTPDLLPYAHVEVASRESIAIVDDGLELKLFPGQPKVNNGIRAEVSVDFPFVDGDTVRYEWSLWLPGDFTPDPSNRWWVFADFHDQPDRTKGETWDGFPANSAPLILGYGHVQAGFEDQGFSIKETSDVLSVTYGTDHRPIALVPFTRDVWHRVRLDVTWSQSMTGALTMTFDGAKVVSARGPNMLNAFQHYFKAGMYRDPGIGSFNRVRLSDVQIKTCAASGC